MLYVEPWNKEWLMYILLDGLTTNEVLENDSGNDETGVLACRFRLEARICQHVVND
jgi:hypothetical protein